MTELQDKLHYCLNLIGKDATHLKFENLDFTDEEIWKNIFHTGNTDSIFQWNTDVGKTALRKLKPNTLKELSAGNSLIRLMNDDGEELLIDKYIRYKEDPEQAIQDMRNYGLNENEIAIVEKILEGKYYLCITQEDIMRLSAEVANFNIVQQNELRKCIAKKQAKEELDRLTELYKRQALAQGHRKVFIDYTWHLILALRGYGFSDIHSDEYSVEGWKSAIMKHYHEKEWQVACLNVDAGAIENALDSSTKSTEYGKIGFAIAEFQGQGGKVYPPDINTAQAEFALVDGKIIFGLKGLVNVGDEAIDQIISHRPYKNFKDFFAKNCWKGSAEKQNKVTRPVVTSLIKAGAFDFYNPNKQEVMKEYATWARMGKREKREHFDFNQCDYATLNKKDYAKLLEEVENYNQFQWEFDAMNYFFSGTPFDFLEKAGIKLYYPEELPEGKPAIIYGSYLDREDKPDKKYIYLSGAKGIYKLRVYLDKWNQYKDLFKRGRSLILKGAYRYGAFTVWECTDYYEWLQQIIDNYETV